MTPAIDANAPTSTRICIDFGTALSKVSVCLDPDMPVTQGVRPLAIGAVSGAEHPLLTPSVMFVRGGRLHFGPSAFGHAADSVDAERDALLSFKTVLGAEHAERALSEYLPPTIDPTGTLRERDALVMYLAYLDQLILEALRRSGAFPEGVENAPRRFTSPVWKKNSVVERHMRAIFNEAAAVSTKLGKLLQAPEGISIAQCRDALDKAAANPGNARLDNGIFEPHAAAATALAFSREPARFVVVFDIGAGTTDIAAFEFNERLDPPIMSEIDEARQCSRLAGDEIDHVLIDLLLRKRGAKDNTVEKSRFQRTCRIMARTLKRELFTTGKCSVKEAWRTTTLTQEELYEDPAFLHFIQLLGDLVKRSLTKVAQRAGPVDTIDVVLAGGGAMLPFLSGLVLENAPDHLGRIKLRVEPLSPTSPLYEGIDPYFSDVFPQIAMSIGGALVELPPTNQGGGL